MQCQQKLEKFTSPQASFELRLNRAICELRNIERSSIVLDVSSAGPQLVQDQFQHCLKIYRTLSEIKSEIENVIKTGRKLCEDKTTKNPKKLGKSIDTLKILYNTLGENVTQSKIILENLIKIGNQINENLKKSEQWIKSQDCESDKPEDLQAGDVDLLIRKSFELYEEYRQICDPSYLEEIKRAIEDTNNRYLDYINVDILKSLNEMKSTLQNMDNISIETLRYLYITNPVGILS